ncbi:MAG: O-antigen ligase family protein [bacterium]|nr:O-antigen ligase family protein [bacterium]
MENGKIITLKGRDAILTILCGVVLGLFSILKPQYVWLILLIPLILIFITSISLFFPLFIALRSSLDIFTDVGFYIGPMNLNVPSFFTIFIIGVASLYLGVMALKGKTIKIHKISVLFGIWILLLTPFVFLSIRNFGFRGLISLREWMRLFSIFILFLLSYNLVRRENRKRFLNLLFLSLLVPLSSGLYQLITHTGMFVKGIHRIYGSIAHPNAFSLYLILFIGITYWKLKMSRHILWYLLLLIELVALIATFSLSGYIMFSILSLFLLLKERKGQEILIAFIIVLFIFAFSTNQQFQKRWERVKLINIDTIKEKKVVDSFTWRIVNWCNLLSLWKEKAFFGYGLQTTPIINPWKIPDEGIGYAPHNDFLRYLVETGLIGFTFYSVFVFLVGYYLFKEYRSSTTLYPKTFLYTLLGVFISWQIGSWVDNFITSTTFQYYFWVFLAVALKSNGLQGKDEEKDG